MDRNIEAERLYKQWCNNVSNNSKSVDIKSAFYAGYDAAFNRMFDLLKRTHRITKSDSLKK